MPSSPEVEVGTVKLSAVPDNEPGDMSGELVGDPAGDRSDDPVEFCEPVDTGEVGLIPSGPGCVGVELPAVESVGLGELPRMPPSGLWPVEV